MARNISTACPLNWGLIGCIFVRQRYKCWRCWRLYFSGRAGDRELLLPLNMLENHDILLCLQPQRKCRVQHDLKPRWCLQRYYYMYLGILIDAAAKIFLLLRLKDVLSIVCLRSLEWSWKLVLWVTSIDSSLCVVCTLYWSNIFFHLILNMLWDPHLWQIEQNGIQPNLTPDGLPISTKKIIFILLSPDLDRT